MKTTSIACTALLALVTLAPTFGQGPRPLTHDDYEQWKSLRGTSYSLDGKWVAYQIEPQWGDGVLEIRQTDGDVVYHHPLGSGARFSNDDRYVVFTINKSKVEERKKKIDDLVKKAEGAEKKEGSTETSNEPGGGGAARPAGAPAGLAGRGPFGGGRRGGAGGPGGAPGAPAGDEASRDRGDLGIMDLSTGKVEIIPKVKGFALPEEFAVLVYHLDKPEPPKDDASADSRPGADSRRAESRPEEGASAESRGPESRPEGGRFAGGRRGGRRGPGAPGGAGPGTASAPTSRPESRPEDPMEKKRQDGSVLVIRDLATGVERKFEDVVNYGLTRKATWLWWNTSAKKPDAKKTYGLFAVKLTGGDVRTLVDGFADFGNMTSDREGSVLAFTSNKNDFAAEKPRSDIWIWNCDDRPAERIVHPETPGMPKTKVPGGGLGFCRDGSVLAFSVQDLPEPDATPILPDEKVVLDIWHWNDGQLQTAQAKRTGRRNSNWTAVWHRAERRLQVLGDATVESVRFLTRDGSRGLATDDTPYEKLSTWDTRYSDVYVVNTLDGSRTKVLEKLRGTVSNSPEGRYLVWFGTDYHWWSLDVATLQKRDLTGSLPVAFQQTDDDHPAADPAWGIAGWTEHDAEIVLNDQFDLWRVSPATGTSACVTDGYGRAETTRLRLEILDREQEHLPTELLLSAVNTETMAEGYFTDSLTEPRKPLRLVNVDKNFGGLTKPKKTDRLFFTLSTFADFPDLWTAQHDFTGMKKLSAANPQQANYRWGKAELVRWINGDGKTLKGVLVKPDGFDPAKKYPMMVYFYERMSQSLHEYVAPSPGTSPIASYYVSNGYLWFMPDIVYEVGYPGESCVKCVVSGVESLIAKGFVDEKAIGAAGHSWGGYQTAFLVTRTNIFAAVESGAPVSNMISAYGGIRYETGISRQFQYEKDQSRIGGTPWQYPMRYWENSPIFFADKVKTPVLILHNDADGAVPWTNGIEYFTALRRLEKEAYLFNYSGEGHGLSKVPNKKDWTRRMSEYFGYHLKHEAMPAWMANGVPYAERDKEKLPHTPSYVEVTARRAESRASATPKPVAVDASQAKSGQ